MPKWVPQHHCPLNLGRNKLYLHPLVFSWLTNRINPAKNTSIVLWIVERESLSELFHINLIGILLVVPLDF